MYTLAERYNEFMQYQFVKGNSEKTIEYYRYCLEPFLLFYGNDFMPGDITKDNLRRYAAKLRSEKLCSVSVKSYTKGIKVFLNWLAAESYIEDDVNSFLPLPKAQRKIIDVLSFTEIHRLFNQFDRTREPGIRNYCICALMFDSGLRKSEVVNIKYSDLRLAEGYIKINGKGSKQRLVPVSPRVIKAVSEYIGFCMMKSTSAEHLFLSVKDHNPIKCAAVDRLFKTLKVKLDIPRLHAHLLRHTFATLYLRNGGNIYELQQILGHSDLEIVQVYLHLSQSNILTGFNRCSPLENLYK